MKRDFVRGFAHALAASRSQENPRLIPARPQDKPLWKPTPYNTYGMNEAILAQQARFLAAERRGDLFPETIYPVIQGRPEQPDDYFDPPDFDDGGQQRLF